MHHSLTVCCKRMCVAVWVVSLWIGRYFGMCLQVCVFVYEWERERDQTDPDKHGWGGVLRVCFELAKKKRQRENRGRGGEKDSEREKDESHSRSSFYMFHFPPCDLSLRFFKLFHVKDDEGGARSFHLQEYIDFFFQLELLLYVSINMLFNTHLYPNNISLNVILVMIFGNVMNAHLISKAKQSLIAASGSHLTLLIFSE